MVRVIVNPWPSLPLRRTSRWLCLHSVCQMSRPLLVGAQVLTPSSLGFQGKSCLLRQDLEKFLQSTPSAVSFTFVTGVNFDRPGAGDHAFFGQWSSARGF